MKQSIYLFTGAGTNFVVLDGRGRDMAAYRAVPRIQELCRKYATDGMMILDTQPEWDFTMEFYNPDGSGGMMCGNGGRCIVAFADLLGLKPAAADGTWHFLAPDGPHEARILEHSSVLPDESSVIPSEASVSHMRSLGMARDDRNKPQPARDDDSLRKWMVRLKMIDVQGVTPMMGGCFLNTGTRHFVQFVDNVEAVDMERDAKPLRWDAAFQPEGTNVNFVQVAPDGLHVRTFEKGVEGETLACGTGLTASALAAFYKGVPGRAGDEMPDLVGHDGQAGQDRQVGHDDRNRPSYRLQCRRGDWLTVEFVPAGEGFREVFLTGPAEVLPLND